jgi:membrane protein involved in colicin uptake
LVQVVVEQALELELVPQVQELATSELHRRRMEGSLVLAALLLKVLREHGADINNMVRHRHLQTTPSQHLKKNRPKLRRSANALRRKSRGRRLRRNGKKTKRSGRRKRQTANEQKKRSENEQKKRSGNETKRSADKQRHDVSRRRKLSESKKKRHGD